MDLQRLAELVEIKRACGFSLYNICFRRAGVGLQWYNEKKHKKSKKHTDDRHWRKFLVIHQYHYNLETAIEQELNTKFGD